MRSRRVQPPLVKTCLVGDFENRVCLEVASNEEDVATWSVELPPSDDMLGLRTASPSTSSEVKETKAGFLTTG